MALQVSPARVLEIQQSALDLTWVEPGSISIANEPEILAGQTISGTPSLRRLKNGAATTDFTISAATVSGSTVSWTSTGVSCTAGDNYLVACIITLSGGRKLVRFYQMIIKEPQG